VSSSLHYKADFSGEPLKDSGIDTGHSSSSQTLNEDSSKVHRYCIYVLSILGNFEEKKKKMEILCFQILGNLYKN
jgi:hypothetical protein